MPVPEWCGVLFWFRGCFQKACFCLPQEYGYYCAMCCRNFTTNIYCLQRLLRCLLDIPIRIVKTFLNWICCAWLFIFVLLALIAAVLSFLIRTYCDEITAVLDVIFLSGIPIFPIMAFNTAVSVANTVIYEWNVMVPYTRLAIEVLVDIEMNVYNNLVSTLGESEIDLLAEDILENVSIVSTLFINVMQAILQSNPQDLKNIADISGGLATELINANQILLPTLQWITGSLFEIMVPLLQALTSLALGTNFIMSQSSMSLFNVAEMKMNGTGNTIPMDSIFKENSSYQSKMNTIDPSKLAPSFVRDLQYKFMTLQNESDLSGIVDDAKDIRARSRKKSPKQQQQQKDTDPRGSFDFRDVKHERLLEDYLDQRDQRIGVTTDILSRDVFSTISKYINPRSIKNKFNSLINTMGFESLHHVNQHLQETYHNGNGFTASFQPHKHSIFSTLPTEKIHKDIVPFSDYLTQRNMTAKQFAIQNTDAAMLNQNVAIHGIHRQLFLALPLLPPLDCFTTIPADPICFITYFLPFPLDGPEWLEDFAGFDCDCDDYDSNAPYFTLAALQNGLVAFQTFASLLFSIPVVENFFSFIMFPAFIEDNLFITNIGDSPSTSEIICALLHLDYFFAALIPLLFAITLIINLFFTLWTCFKIYVELRILTQHQRLVKEILDTKEIADLWERIFERDVPQHIVNKAIYCGNSNEPFYNRDSYYHELERKNMHNALKQIALESSLGLDTAQQSIGSEIGGHNHVSTDNIKQKQQKLHTKRQLMYYIVTQINPHASEKQIIKYMHLVYPELYNHNVKSRAEILADAKKQFVSQSPPPYPLPKDNPSDFSMHHSVMPSFHQHLHSNILNPTKMNTHVEIHQHYHTL